MKYIKNIIESIRSARKQRKQRKEVKARLMASYVEATPIPNIYKVEFFSRSGEGYDKYNLYDAKENSYLFNRCKTTLKHLKYGLYFVRDHEKSPENCAGIFDATANCFVYAKTPSLNIRQFPNGKSDTVLLQSNDKLIVFNLKTKSVECTTVV
jgi:hypothetical protein